MLFFRVILFYVYECLAYMYCMLLCTCLVPEEVGRGVNSPGTGVIDSYWIPRSFWESSLDPLQEQVPSSPS